MPDSIKYRPVGKQDENLEYVKENCKKAVQMLLEAMEKMEYCMRFKAFDFYHLKKEEVNAMSDLISTAIAIELKEQAKETLDTITYDCAMVQHEEEHYHFWITAKREKPDWSAVPKMEETPIEEVTIPKLQDVSGCSGENTVNYIV